MIVKSPFNVMRFQIRNYLVLCLALLLVSYAVAQRSIPSLQIYSIDVEGGQATLLVTPGGQSLLVDAGWPGYSGRDADRIFAAAKAAGVQRIDYLLITHYHRDHVGGVPQLAERIKIGTFIDHGPNLENSEQTNTGYADYQAVLAKSGANHVIAKPGDRIPLTGLDVVVLTAAGQHISTILPGGGQNTSCGSDPLPPDDPSENAASLGILVTYGNFHFLDLGDLTKKKELGLMCPNNPIGRVDAFLVSHHGLDQSNSKALVDGIRPRVAIVNNGPHKGGSPEAWQTVHQSQGLEDLWQLHYAMDSDKAHNSNENVIANLNDSDGNCLKLVAQTDGSFTITNSRNNYRKNYPPLPAEPR